MVEWSGSTSYRAVSATAACTVLIINANPTATDAILRHRFIDASAKGKRKSKKELSSHSFCAGFFGRQETTDLQQGGQQKYN